MLEAVSQAINTHPGVQAQWHALLGAGARQDAERGPGRPQVDLFASVGRESQTRPGSATGTYTHTNGTLSVSQLLFDGGAVSAAVRQAGHDKLSRFYRLLDGTESMAFDAAVAYADLSQGADPEHAWYQAAARLATRLHAGWAFRFAHRPTRCGPRGGEVSGGTNSARKRPMLCAASSDRNWAHCRSSDQKLATTSSTRAALNQQALQRALNSGGGSR